LPILKRQDLVGLNLMSRFVPECAVLGGTDIKHLLYVMEWPFDQFVLWRYGRIIV